MFAHIEGIVSEKGTDSLVLDVGGVGFLINVSRATLAQAPQSGEVMKVYTVLNVREDAMELFGFYSREEKHMYERLRAVSGVGSRTALAILSALSVRDLSVALVTGDAKTLERVPGIGKKTAQRLVLELREKIEDAQLTSAGAAVTPVKPAGAGSVEAEAVEALIGLGYTSAEAAKAVSAAAAQTDNLNEMIFLALKKG